MSSSKTGWRLAWALGLTTIVSYGTTQYLFGVLVVPVEHDTGWSRATLSAAFSTAFLVAGAVGVPIGRHVDVHGARTVMTVGSLIAAASLALVAQARFEWQFVLTWALGVGVAQALTFYPVTFTVINSWFAGRRGAALALLTLLGGFASVVFYPLAGYLVATQGWRPALLAMAGIQVAVCVPIHFVALRHRPPAHDAERDGAPGPALGDALRMRAFLTLTASAGLTTMAHAAVLVHLVAYLVGLRFDPVFAAGLAGLLGVASLPSRLILNLLSDRLGPRAMLVLSCGLLAVGALLLLATARLHTLVWAFVGVYGFAFGAVSPLRAAVMAEQFGRRAYGGITAAQGVPVAVLGALGPVVAGWLYQAAGGYALALALTAAAFGLGMAALLLTPAPPPGAPASPPGPAPAAA